jgi:hypothetical protein
VALAAVAVGVGALAYSLVPESSRLIATAAGLAALGTLDLANRTPHVWRQVPQRLVRQLTPGTLGVMWGADLGTLISTQKTTSLIWGSLLIAVLATPPHLGYLLLIVLAVAAPLSVAVLSVLHGIADSPTQPGRLSVRRMRGATGVVLLAVAVTLALTVVTPS